MSEMAKNVVWSIENTRFVYLTNFSGDAARDNFGDSRRKCNIIIPDEQMARDMMKAGVKVRQTKCGENNPNPEEFVPEYFVTAQLKYRNKIGDQLKYPPRVYLVVGNNEPQALDEESVAVLDSIRVKNVNVMLNQYEYDPVSHGMSMYIRTMYVEQDVDSDPFASRYARHNDEAPWD